MTGFIVSVFPFRNRVSFKEAFEGLELGEGKLSRPVLRGPGGRKAAWLLGIEIIPQKITKGEPPAPLSDCDKSSHIAGDPLLVHPANE